MTPRLLSIALVLLPLASVAQNTTRYSNQYGQPIGSATTTGKWKELTAAQQLASDLCARAAGTGDVRTAATDNAHDASVTIIAWAELASTREGLYLLSRIHRIRLHGAEQRVSDLIQTSNNESLQSTVHGRPVVTVVCVGDAGHAAAALMIKEGIEVFTC